MKLLIFNGRRAEAKEYEIIDGQVIGRDQSQSDITVDDRYVSSAHAIIEVEDNDVYIRDLGSENGLRSRFGSSLPTKVKLSEKGRVVVGEHAIEIKQEFADRRTAELLPPSSLYSLIVPSTLSTSRQRRYLPLSRGFCPGAINSISSYS